MDARAKCSLPHQVVGRGYLVSLHLENLTRES